MNLPRLILIGIAMTISVVAQSQILAPGLAMVAKVQGMAQIERLDGSAPRPLVQDSEIKMGDLVSTGPDSSLLFVISNGAKVQLAPNSRVRVVELVQERFPNTVAADSIRLEPSRSMTRLMLLQGEIVGLVPQLMAASKFGVIVGEKENDLDATVFRMTSAPTAGRAGVLSPRKFTAEDDEVFRRLSGVRQQ